MLTLLCRIFKMVLRKKYNINPFLNIDVVEKIKTMNKKYETNDIKKKGYSIIRKETANKTKYWIIRKDSNQLAKKIVYFLHGGSYISGLNNMYQTFSYPLCDVRDDIEVILLDYDLAPEFKYPTQINEALDLWDVITQTYSPEDIIVGGDSSGGNLALVLLLKLKQERNISPKASFFLSPWTDMTASGESYYNNYQKDVLMGEKKCPLTDEKAAILRKSDLYCYIGDADRKDPYISPIFGDYSTFPKSLFIVGSREMLLDDTLSVVNKIKENGNDVELINERGMFHIYPIHIKYLYESRIAHKKIRNFIAESFC
eukprot:jgi/Orpsp1_1/1176569/evm.model.c7180000058120.1